MHIAFGSFTAMLIVEAHRCKKTHCIESLTGVKVNSSSRDVILIYLANFPYIILAYTSMRSAIKIIAWYSLAIIMFLVIDWLNNKIALIRLIRKVLKNRN